MTDINALPLPRFPAQVPGTLLLRGGPRRGSMGSMVPLFRMAAFIFTAGPNDTQKPKLRNTSTVAIHMQVNLIFKLSLGKIEAIHFLQQVVVT